MRIGRNADRKSPKGGELSLTPMIDVVFLLLIFFMVGTKFAGRDRQIANDLGGGGSGGPAMWDVRLHISNSGTDAAPRPKLVVDQVVMPDWAHLRARLGRLARLPDGTKDPVIIQADDDALHEWVITALDTLKQLGFRNISFQR